MSLGSTNDCVGMVRPTWNERQYFLDLWKQKDITALICQRKTKDVTRLCLESFLRFYPDCPVLVVDGDSQDDSTLYLQWMAIKNPNVKLWIRPNSGTGFTSHGATMHDALRQITTKYVLLLDSDTITERGGWIEQMLEIFNSGNKFTNEKDNLSIVVDHKLFALGSLMLPSRSGEAITPPKDETDVLRYAHPSCSIIDREKYIEICKTNTYWHDGQIIPNKASDHGSPLVWTMMGAEQLGYRVEYFPVDKYVSHLSGASWVGWEGDTSPKTIWPDDHDVKVRPFVTFLSYVSQVIPPQLNNDYEMLFTDTRSEKHNVVMHFNGSVEVNNVWYKFRFNVRGEYVCQTEGYFITEMFVSDAIKAAIELSRPEEFDVNEVKFIRRDIWQKRECLS